MASQPIIITVCILLIYLLQFCTSVLNFLAFYIVKHSSSDSEMLIIIYSSITLSFRNRHIVTNTTYRNKHE